MKHILLLAVLLGMAPCAYGEDITKPLTPQPQNWSFTGVFGTYDKGALQRGFQVYREVCSACHSLNLVAYHDLAAPGGPGFSEAAARAIAASSKFPAEPNAHGETSDENGIRLLRPGMLNDHLPPPFPNEQAARAANGGVIPPDLSLILKARRGGPDYVYALLTGFNQSPPPGFAVPNGKHYHPYFPGRAITMPAPLQDNAVSFADGTPASVENEAKAVVTFLAWASAPELEARHKMGFTVVLFLAGLAGLLFLTYRRIWKPKG